MALNNATLAGVPLEMGDPIAWPIRVGPVPSTLSLRVKKGRAEQIASHMGEYVSLRVGHSNGDGSVLEVEGLWITHVSQGTHPDERTVHVSDKRIWLKRWWFSKSYNVRRSTGDTELVDPDNPEASALEDDQAYAAYSLYEGQYKWTARLALIDFLDWLGAPASFDRLDESAFPEVEIENLILDGTADVCLGRLLDMIPGIDFYIDKAGTYVFIDTTRAAGAAELLSGRQPHFPGYGGTYEWPVKVDRSGIRAKKVRVLFSPRFEIEVHCSDSIVSEPVVIAENVMPLPDRQLTVDGIERGQMSWVKFGDSGTDRSGVMSAWEADNDNAPLLADAGGVGHLSQKLIRDHYVTGLSLIWDDFVKKRGPQNPSYLWANRLQAVMNHWRQTWRIQQSVWKYLESFSPYRLAIVQNRRRQGVQSPVYMDYLAMPTHLATVRGADELQGRLSLGAVIKSTQLDANGKPRGAPWIVVPKDAEAGVFSFRPVVDPAGEWSKLYPGIPNTDKLPANRPNDWNRDPDFVHESYLHIVLKKGWTCKTIISVAPGITNNLYGIDVMPYDVDVYDATYGPSTTIRIMPSLVTADFAWKDGNFRFIDSILEGGNEYGGLDDSLLNREHMQAIAHAAAKAYYDAMEDRVETSGVETKLDPEAEPWGGASSVVHTLRPTGESTTTFMAAGMTRPVNFWRFLPQATQELVMRSL